MCHCGNKHHPEHPRKVGLIEKAIRESSPDFTVAEAMTFHSTCSTEKIIPEQHKPASPDNRL